MANKTGVRLDYRQDSSDEIMDRAKAECAFTDRLYEILLAHQRGRGVSGNPDQGAPPGNVGELNPAMSRLYNLIWSAALGLNHNARTKKSKQQEVIA